MQGDNAAQVSRQDQETVKTRSYTLPAGLRLEETQERETEAGAPVTSFQAVVVSAPTPVVERVETRAKTELGAAQKDTAHKLGAKLSNLKGIVGLGAGLFVFGLASIFYLPLRAIIGSVTTSITITGGGALMVLPSLVVGNELLILGGVAVLVAAWFLAHRHGRLRGLVEAK